MAPGLSLKDMWLFSEGWVGGRAFRAEGSAWVISWEQTGLSGVRMPGWGKMKGGSPQQEGQGLG